MKRILLACVCGLAFVCSPAAAVKHGAPPIVKIEVPTRTQFLSTRNEALEKAMDVHNLMNQIPDLEKMAQTIRVLDKTAGRMEKYMQALNRCGEKRFSGRFKNAGVMVKKVRDAYATKTAELKIDKPQNPNSIVPVSISEQNANIEKKRAIEKELIADAFKNASKWGGVVVERSSDEVPPESMRNSQYNLLEEMNSAEAAVTQAQIGHTQVAESFMRMQSMFVGKLNELGVQEPELDFIKGTKVNAVHKALKELKKQYLTEAKEYITKLDAQDKAYPQLAARRASRSKSKNTVLADIKGQFPDVFTEMENIDQMTPQTRQQIIVTALEKDTEGEVYLTETNASEVDQRMAEKRANKALINKMMDQAYGEFDNILAQEIDLGSC